MNLSNAVFFILHPSAFILEKRSGAVPKRESLSLSSHAKASLSNYKYTRHALLS